MSLTRHSSSQLPGSARHRALAFYLLVILGLLGAVALELRGTYSHAIDAAKDRTNAVTALVANAISESLRTTDDLGQGLAVFDDWIENDTTGTGLALRIVDFDGQLLTLRPDTPASETTPVPIDRIIDQPALVDQFIQGTTVVSFRLRSQIDGIDRIWTARVVGDLPLVVVAGESWRAVLAPWWRDAGAFAIGWLGFAMLGALGLRGYLRIARYRADAESREARLSALMACVPDAILILDRTGRIEISHAPNGSPIPAGQAIQGRHFAEIVDTGIAARIEAAIDTLRDTAGPMRFQGEWTGAPGDDAMIVSVTVSRTDAAGSAEAAGFVCLIQDMTAIRSNERQIERLAFYDPLTALPNRRLFLDRLRQSIKDTRRAQTAGVVLFVDLDNFKTLNDTMGHDVGDLLLRQVAERLQAVVRTTDTVARLGGDEFTVLLTNLAPHPTQAAVRGRDIALKAAAAIGRPYDLQGHSHHCTSSIGVATFIDDGTDAQDVIKQADIAMYKAKASGRDTVCLFEARMQTQLSRRAALEADLHAAVGNGEMDMLYQAQTDTTGATIGAEALVRWHHPTEGDLAPAEFIPIAEETGQILTLGTWILDQAAAQLAAWARSPATAGLDLSVNISSRQFYQSDFANRVRDVIEKHSIDGSKLILEVTEGLLLKNAANAATQMATLRRHGIRFSIDDFGTGHSSLATLKQLPLDIFKIDRSFVADLPDDPDAVVIVRSIIDLARNLGYAVIAEGVETAAQRDLLIDLGCTIQQGFLFGKPGAADAINRLVDAA